MKKILLILLVIVLGFIGILYYNRKPILNRDEAMILGEEKYLTFLWMVDGAFNDEKLGYSIKVNNHELKDENKSFKCVYQNDKKSCISKNLEEEFKKIFSSSITYKDVYSDGVSNSWYERKNNKDIFINLDTCNIKRMSQEQMIDVDKIEPGRITYVVYFNKNDRDHNKLFILVYEDGDWKISSAYYHDLCGMDYNIR